MGLHILLALPVIIVPFRRSIEGLEASLVTLWRLRDGRSQQQLTVHITNSLQVLGAPLLEQTDQQYAPLRPSTPLPRLFVTPCACSSGL
jgi:hypothetical protein